NEPAGMVLNGDDLFIAELDGNKISKIDINVAIPTAEDVVTGLDGPVGMILNGDDLYIAEISGNRISKLNLGTLSINENIEVSNIKLYPNPSPDFIQIS
ncbi:hypothetical protein Q4Q35_17475, partial [Flavivirga aquimarina]